MENLEESLIALDAEIPPALSSPDKPIEPAASLEAILDEKIEEIKQDEPLNPIALEDASEDIVSSEIEEAKVEEDQISSDRIKEAKSNLSEFLKVSDDPPQNAVLTEFDDGLESARDKIIEDLMSTSENSAKDELLTYTAHFEELHDENKLENHDDKTVATVDINVEDKIKELLVDESEVKLEESASNNTLDSSKASNDDDLELLDKQTSSTDIIIDKLPTVTDTSKDDIDTLLSTLMPELESSTKPEDAIIIKKPVGSQSIQYLRDVLDKSDDRGVKRKMSTDSESDEKSPKKPKVLPNLPEVTLTKVGSKKRQMNFDDLMSNLTKIKLPSSLWKVKISAGTNPFSIVEFHEREKLVRSVKFLKDDFQYKISFNNVPVELMGAPPHVQSLDDVSILLNIVNNLIKNDPIVHYL